MSCIKKLIGCSVTALALCAVLSGCSHDRVTAANAAPNVIPGDNRQAMIKWHQEHDKKAAPAPGG